MCAKGREIGLLVSQGQTIGWGGAWVSSLTEPDRKAANSRARNWRNQHLLSTNLVKSHFIRNFIWPSLSTYEVMSSSGLFACISYPFISSTTFMWVISFSAFRVHGWGPTHSSEVRPRLKPIHSDHCSGYSNRLRDRHVTQPEPLFYHEPFTGASEKRYCSSH